MTKQKQFKKERIPSYTYIKEYDNFEDGYANMTSVVPDIKMYAGENFTYNEVINSLLNTISESIPSPINPNFPNTMSFSINSKEVGFLTDDQLAFGWKIFLQKNNDSMAFQFRVTFLSLSISKRKYIDALVENGWKEKDLSDKQSRFWNEIHTNSRPSYKDALTNKQPSNKQPEKRQDVPEVPSKNDRDDLVEVTIAGTNQKVLVKKEDLNNKPKEKQNIVIETKKPQEPVKEEVITPPVQQPQRVIVSKPNIVKETQEPLTEMQYSNKQQVKITDETGYIEPSRDISECAIYPYEGQATFRIKHFGNEFIYNINDRQDGIFVDRNSRNIKIDNVVYNYQTFKVTQLDEDLEDTTSSTYVPGVEGKMREHGPVDDSVFIPASIIEKTQNPDLSYSETVIATKKKQDREARAQGFNPQPQQFNSVKMPKMANGKPALVIDKQPQPQEMKVPGVAVQTVRISDNSHH